MKRKLTLIIITASLLASVFLPQAAFATNYGNVNIISDSVMNNTGTMSKSQIESFLNSFPGTCLGESFTTPDPQGWSGSSYGMGGNVNAGTAIYDIATHYDINPQVLIATIEKEQGLINRDGNCHYDNPLPLAPSGQACGNPNGTGPNYCTEACPNSYSGGCVAIATGYACPGYCRRDFNGFSYQISGTSWSLRFAEARSYGELTGYAGFDSGDQDITYSGPMTPGYRQRVSGGASIYYDGSYTDEAGDTMYITNGATASMLSYTPFYAASYTDNRLFYTSFSEWFGSPTTGALDLTDSLSTNELEATDDTTMNPGDYIVSPDGQFVTLMQYDGNLVTYAGDNLVWQSNTAGNYGAYATFQTDGNLVIYKANGGGVAWSPNTYGDNADRLVLGDDGNLGIYTGSTLDWSTNNRGVNTNNDVGSQISSGTTLNAGDYLSSSDGVFFLEMQSDGNLVLRGPDGSSLWASNTWGHPGSSATLQTDGNLVIRDSSGNVLWASNVYGQGASTLTLQTDGNLVVYKNGGAAVWSTGTSGEF
jgi:hypothetical protein